MTTAPVNYATPYFDEDDNITAFAHAAITGKRLVVIAGDIKSGPGLNTSVSGGNIQVDPAAAGGHALGVAEEDKAINLLVGVLLSGIVPVTASGGITAGDEVQVATGGKAATKTTGLAVGMALATAVDGADCMVYLYSTCGIPGAPGSGNQYAQGTPAASAGVVIDTQTGATVTPSTASLVGGNSATGTQLNTAITGIIADVAALATDYNKTIEDVADLYTTVTAMQVALLEYGIWT